MATIADVRTDTMLRIVTWNLERKKPTTPTGAAAIERIGRAEPDIVVVTEARADSLSTMGGHSMLANPVEASRFAHDERKVIAWSKTPWRKVDTVGHPGMPTGRFVSGITTSPIGDIRVVGVCIPWHMCDVTSGSKDRKPWEQHLAWLRCFEQLAPTFGDMPTIVAGDFNQRVPRQPRTNRRIAAALGAAFAGFPIVTGGIPSGCTRHGLDHIAIDDTLDAEDVWGWPNDDGGVRMSDHDAAVADLRHRSS